MANIIVAQLLYLDAIDPNKVLFLCSQFILRKSFGVGKREHRHALMISAGTLLKKIAYEHNIADARSSPNFSILGVVMICGAFRQLDMVLFVLNLSLKNVCCKRQSHFLPEENDKFLDKEECQVLAAADTDAAKDVIATAEVSRKTIPTYPESRNPIFKSISTMEGSCITSERGIYNIKYVTFMIVNIKK
uniref:Uncharacterized protein n=1 Tax=Cucumis melo TaxID=3656 RepID=A0A9I9EII3_CUCME